MVRLRSVTLTCVLLAALAIPASVGAAKPDSFRVPIADIGIRDDFASEICGFDIWFDAVGHITLKAWLDGEGSPTREVNNYAIRLTYYSGAASVFAQDVGVDRITYNEDGTLLQVIVGSVQSFTAKGQGRVYAANGQTTLLVTFNEETEEFEAEVLSVHGPHDEDQLAVLCEVLAP